MSTIKRKEEYWVIRLGEKDVFFVIVVVFGYFDFKYEEIKGNV